MHIAGRIKLRESSDKVAAQGTHFYGKFSHLAVPT